MPVRPREEEDVDLIIPGLSEAQVRRLQRENRLLLSYAGRENPFRDVEATIRAALTCATRASRLWSAVNRRRDPDAIPDQVAQLQDESYRLVRLLDDVLGIATELSAEVALARRSFPRS